MFIPSNNAVKNMNLQPSSVWNISQSALPEQFNVLHNWWQQNVSDCCSAKVKSRLSLSYITGNLPIYLKGIADNLDGSTNVLFIIHGGGKFSEQKLWTMPLSHLTMYCTLIGGPGTPASHVDSFRINR